MKSMIQKNHIVKLATFLPVRLSLVIDYARILRVAVSATVSVKSI